jgi:CheY-like chemotaxis protein/HPt (histidine-containing phosphotransfer) domain-containing protein
MTPEQVARVFRPFAQGDDTMTRQFGGTGLGLTICRRLARLMGGDIELDTGPDSGSRFTLVLPTGPLQSTAMISDPAEAARSAEVSPNDTAAAASLTLRGRVLLAEDGPENQIIIGAYLRRAGAEVVIANDGREAVEMARRERFDVILMDMQMPHLDGYGAASKLRALGLKVPIVALTAHAMSEDKDKCLNAGCTDYLSKPVDRRELVATIHRHIAGDPAKVPAQPAQASAAATGAAMDVAIEGRSTLDDPVLREYLPEFVAQLPGHVREMEATLAAQDLAELVRHVHQLRGAGGMYGYPQLTTAAAEAERRVVAKEPLEAVRQGVEELVRLVRSVEGYDRQREAAGPPRVA